MPSSGSTTPGSAASRGATDISDHTSSPANNAPADEPASTGELVEVVDDQLIAEPHADIAADSAPLTSVVAEPTPYEAASAEASVVDAPIDESSVVTGGTDASAPVVQLSAAEPVTTTDPDDQSDRAVITRLAAAAARGVDGVHDLGNAAARVVGSVRQSVTSEQGAQGIKVTIDDAQVGVDVTLVTEYPVPVRGVIADVRLAVSLAIAHLVGERPSSIDVTVADIHVPSDDEEPKESEAAEPEPATV